MISHTALRIIERMRIFITALFFLLSSVSFAHTTQTPLAIDQAFQLTGTARDYQTILVHWNIAPGYYLYRDQLYFNIDKKSHVHIGEPLLPYDSFEKNLPGLGKYQVYKDSVTVIVPVIDAKESTALLRVCFQGCSDFGYCYPPTTMMLPINLADNYMQPVRGEEIIASDESSTESTSSIEKALGSSHLYILILSFLGFGLLIAFTPCVLPMIPILSSIIMGQDKITHVHSFFLALAYVLGMAITYAVAGLFFGLLGGSLQASFQQPWMIILFSLLFIAMALSLFGFYNLELPQSLRHKMAMLSEHQKRGSYIGVAIMGILSTLILSPCVTPPLVGVLSYIGQTGSAFTGFIALFSMGIGMGTPLLLLGAFGPKFIPKSGAWMNAVKNILGVFMLGVAIWMIQRLTSDFIAMLLWSALILGSAIAMGALESATNLKQRIIKSLGVLLFIFGIINIIGAFLGNHDPLKPLNIFKLEKQQYITFNTVTTLSEAKEQIAASARRGKPVMLDFYATWCAACKEMDNDTFANTDVKKALAHYTLIRADVTKNNANAKALEKYFNVVAPPTILFFDKNGNEIKTGRVIGALSAEPFLQHLENIQQ